MIFNQNWRVISGQIYPYERVPPRDIPFLRLDLCQCLPATPLLLRHEVRFLQSIRVYPHRWQNRHPYGIGQGLPGESHWEYPGYLPEYHVECRIAVWARDWSFRGRRNAREEDGHRIQDEQHGTFFQVSLTHESISRWRLTLCWQRTIQPVSLLRVVLSSQIRW